MKRVFLHTEKQRALTWGLMGVGLLLMLLAPSGSERAWVPFLIAAVAVEMIGITLRHLDRRQGDRKVPR